MPLRVPTTHAERVQLVASLVSRPNLEKSRIPAELVHFVNEVDNVLGRLTREDEDLRLALRTWRVRDSNDQLIRCDIPKDLLRNYELFNTELRLLAALANTILNGRTDLQLQLVLNQTGYDATSASQSHSERIEIVYPKEGLEEQGLLRHLAKYGRAPFASPKFQEYGRQLDLNRIAEEEPMAHAVEDTVHTAAQLIINGIERKLDKTGRYANTHSLLVGFFDMRTEWYAQKYASIFEEALRSHLLRAGQVFQTIYIVATSGRFGFKWDSASEAIVHRAEGETGGS